MDIAGVVPPAVKPRGWLREPLFHFLIAGAALYVGASWLAPVPDSGRSIVIDEDRLVTTLQQRSGVTDERAVRAGLAAMPSKARATLVHEAAAEEALWREGRALGLDQVDGVVRMRVLQQMRLLLAGEATRGIAVSDEEVAAFYAANRNSYGEPAAFTFSHLFYAGVDGEARARTALARLRAGSEQPDQTGDRFLYQSNYSSAGTEELAGQFGIGFVETINDFMPGSSWQGPVKSDHGWHIVLLRSKEEAQVPPLAAIESRVREDALAARRARAVDASVDRLLERYRVSER
ncbi:MAG: peptidylprolyl isomerase [Pseudomonadota bacterium]